MYKVVQINPSRKIEIKRIVENLVILFLKSKLLCFFERKSWPEHITNV